MQTASGVPPPPPKKNIRPTRLTPCNKQPHVSKSIWMLPYHEMFVPLILRHTNEPPGVSLMFIWLTAKLRSSAHCIRQDSISEIVKTHALKTSYLTTHK